MTTMSSMRRTVLKSLLIATGAGLLPTTVRGQQAYPSRPIKLISPWTAGGTSDIVLRACPFGELARSHGDVICRAHRGIVEGALAEIDAPLRVASFDPFTGPGLCLLKLEPR